VGILADARAQVLAALDTVPLRAVGPDDVIVQPCAVVDRVSTTPAAPTVVVVMRAVVVPGGQMAVGPADDLVESVLDALTALPSVTAWREYATTVADGTLWGHAVEVTLHLSAC